MMAYHKLVPITEPRDDHDDRNALYAVQVDLTVSVGWSANKRLRHLAIEEMKRLIAKYPDGFQDYNDGGRVQETAEAA